MFLQRLGLTGIVSVALYSSMKEAETKEIWCNLQNPKDAELEGKQGPKHIRYYFQSYYLTILTSTFW